MSEAPAWFVEGLGRPAEPGRTVVEDCEIAWTRRGSGSGPVVLLVHGGASHQAWWDGVVAALPEDRPVVTVDLSGHGDSAVRPAYDEAQWCRELLAVAEEHGGRAFLVGHSMGGLVGVNLASRHGDRLRGLLTVDSPVRRRDPDPVESPRGRAFRTPRSYRDRETAEARFRLQPDQDCEQPWLLRHLAAASVRQLGDGRWSWRYDPTVYRTVGRAPTRDLLGRVCCPFTYLRGEWSELVPARALPWIGRQAPGARFVTVAGARHHVLLDQPVALAAVIDALA